MSQSVDLLEKLRDTIAQNQELQSYCQATFSKNATVFLGIDEEEPPQQSELPSIILFGIDREKGASNRILYSIAVNIAIVDESEAILGQDTKTLEGVSKIENMLEFVENAVFANQPNLGKVDISGETLQRIFFPIFAIQTVIKIEKIKTSRGR